MTYLCGVKREKQSKKTAGIIKLNILVIIGFVVLLGAYLIVVDDLVGGGYRLREAQQRVKKERDLAKKFENKQAEQGALHNLQQAAKELNLVSIDKVRYIDAIDSSVALVNKFNQ